MPNPTTATWATERAVARAREMWDAGTLTVDIGRAAGCSRNAIVGYARRHHWPPHPNQPRGGSPPGVSKPRKPLEPQQKAKRDLLPAAKPQKRVVVTKNRDIWASCRPETLAVPSPPHRSCQWIPPECNGRPWRMCDAPVARPGVAYCAEHFPRCYSRPPRWAYAAEAAA